MTWTTILGLMLPSIVVLLAVYLMFRQYFNHQMQTFILTGKKSREEFTLPMRLQAYERLTLLCERIELADLILRLKSQGSSANELQSVLLVAVQQEYEHNLTQQLYVSEELWKILMLAKSKTMDLLSLAGHNLSSNASGDDYVKKLFELADKEEKLPSQIAKSAVKAESSIWL
jgi:hypothetical protein